MLEQNSVKLHCEKARTSLYVTICQIIVLENRCLNTAEHIQIITIDKY